MSSISSSRREFLALLGVGAVSSTVAGAADRIASRASAPAADNVLATPIRLANDAVRRATALTDYSATFVKTELVNGEILKARIALKIRQQPKSVYMKFVSPKAGRELIYVEGMNGGNLLVHETGFAALVGTLKLDPNGSLALSESRHPVTMVGIREMTEVISQQWTDEAAQYQPQVQYYPNATLGSTACRAIQTTHARPAADIKFQRTRLFIAQESGLPVRVQQFDFDRAGGEPILVEDYAYLDLNTNIGLTNIDFDTQNPAYNF